MARLHTTESARRQLVSLSDAAEYRGVHPRTIRRMIAAGQLTGYRFGSCVIRVDLNQIDALTVRIPGA
jgi:excisionase family DNA binding protein